jgi:hypothetical protein
MYVEKAAGTMFVRKRRAFKVDEIDGSTTKNIASEDDYGGWVLG